jgi:hypothetical protein
VPRLTRLGRRAGGTDRGAVTALVAILLSSGVLLGMTAYAIDIGTLYAYRDQAINAANASALAAAERCVRPPINCGALDDTYARASIPGGGVKLESNSLGDAVCGLDREGGQLSPCSDTSGAKGCFQPARSRPSYTEVHAVTTAPGGSTVYPAGFAGAVVPGYQPYGVQACSRVAYGVPQGPYNALGMSYNAFKALTGGTHLPKPHAFQAVYDTDIPLDAEIELDMEQEAGATADRSPDLVYYDSNGNCEVDTRENGSLLGTVNDAGSTVTLSPDCRSLLDTLEAAPSRANPWRPYLLIPIYQTITEVSGPNMSFGGMAGVAAFQVTGDHLGSTGTPDWLNPTLSQSDYCHPFSTKSTDRCIRGYFLWVNIIDGNQPSTRWRTTLAVATYKTVG